LTRVNAEVDVVGRVGHRHVLEDVVDVDLLAIHDADCRGNRVVAGNDNHLGPLWAKGQLLGHPDLDHTVLGQVMFNRERNEMTGLLLHSFVLGSELQVEQVSRNQAFALDSDSGVQLSDLLQVLLVFEDFDEERLGVLELPRGCDSVNSQGAARSGAKTIPSVASSDGYIIAGAV